MFSSASASSWVISSGGAGGSSGSPGGGGGMDGASPGGTELGTGLNSSPQTRMDPPVVFHSPPCTDMVMVYSVRFQPYWVFSRVLPRMVISPPVMPDQEELLLREAVVCPREL